MLRSIVSRTYEHGPESWTHKWTRALNRVGTQGSFDSLRVLAVAILPTIAREAGKGFEHNGTVLVPKRGASWTTTRVLSEII